MRFSSKARGNFEAGITPRATYVYQLTWYDIAGDGGRYLTTVCAVTVERRPVNWDLSRAKKSVL